MFVTFVQILLNENLSLNQTLLRFWLSVTQTWMILMILAISVSGHLPLIQKDSVTDNMVLQFMWRKHLLFFFFLIGIHFMQGCEQPLWRMEL